ncbi:MAG: creatininase family protein [Bacteriovoracia bacterium]
MFFHKYEELSLEDLESIPREKTLVFIPLGPLEQHGPHLPLGIDAIMARHFSEKMAERLSGKFQDYHFILMPTLFAGSDTLTYKGSIEVDPKIVRGLLYSITRKLAKDGFRTLIAVGAHGGPRHMVVMEEVSTRMRWRHRARMISASAPIIMKTIQGKLLPKIESYLEKKGISLSQEEREALKTDYHGGMMETSLLLAAHPELVKQSYLGLETSSVASPYKIGKNSLLKVGNKLGYLGTPRLAKKEFGEATLEAILDEVEPMLVQFIKGEKGIEKKFHSIFYYIPFFRTDFRMLLILTVYILAVVLSWWFLSQFVMEMYK